MMRFGYSETRVRAMIIIALSLFRVGTKKTHSVQFSNSDLQEPIHEDSVSQNKVISIIKNNFQS